MKTAVVVSPLLVGPVSTAEYDAEPEATPSPQARAGSGSGRLAAFVALTKPRIAVMVLITVAVGFLLGARGRGLAPIGDLAVAMIATGAVAAGASVWNQVIERDRDARMRRTAGRPIPAGRVGVGEALVFGSVLGLGGVVALASFSNGVAAAVAAATFLLYVGVYTPLKPVTTLNTAIGAIPGALPPVIGWAAATGRLQVGAFALFLIVFLWQFPHFLAIAWMHREDYARGGHRMLPNVDPDGSMTGRQALWHAALIVPVGLWPYFLGLGGQVYFVGALALGLFYFYHSARFCLRVSDGNARRLLWASIWYLPLVLVLLLVNPRW